jgi:hypothetical protein
VRLGLRVDILDPGADGLTEHLGQPAPLESEVLHGTCYASGVEHGLGVRSWS